MPCVNDTSDQNALTVLEAVIGYRFTDRALCEQAFVHSSFASDSGMDAVASNQRLEFLGDAVIELAVSEALYKAHPDWEEGRLTQARAAFVAAKALAEVARRLDLGRHLTLARGEDITGGRDRDSNLADAVEALVGAIHLDGGVSAARRFVREHILAGREHDDEIGEPDPKTVLQEVVQARGGPPPSYDLVDSRGPSHRPTFVVAVHAGGPVLATGEGTTKKDAERVAAAAALKSRSWASDDERQAE